MPGLGEMAGHGRESISLWNRLPHGQQMEELKDGAQQGWVGPQRLRSGQPGLVPGIHLLPTPWCGQEMARRVLPSPQSNCSETRGQAPQPASWHMRSNPWHAFSDSGGWPNCCPALSCWPPVGILANGKERRKSPGTTTAIPPVALESDPLLG